MPNVAPTAAPPKNANKADKFYITMIFSVITNINKKQEYIPHLFRNMSLFLIYFISSLFICGKLKLSVILTKRAVSKYNENMDLYYLCTLYKMDA